MALLSVNVNKVATLRNTRPLDYPSPVRISRLALEAGASGITVHPRPDQRHIRPSDVGEIATLVREYPGREFNVEGNPFHKYVPLIEQWRPHQCTLVPDAEGQSTSDHGFDLSGDNSRLIDVIAELKPLCGRISLFMDPDPRQIERAAKLGIQRVELYTEPYAADPTKLPLYVEAAKVAHAAGLGLNAGHDLTLDNLPALVKAIPQIDEVSIGHALIADALEFGIAETVRKYIAAASV